MRVIQSKPESNTKRLKTVSLEKAWPVLSPFCLAYTELERDEWYPFIQPEQIPFYIDQAIRIGQEAACSYAKDFNLQELINVLLKQGVGVRFLNQHALDEWVRAQYLAKTSTIEIYRPSLDQMEQFFRMMNQPVCTEDIICLHLYHEWFHHLEETKCGRTDLALPKIKIKKGLLTTKKTIRRTREIAAHAFTQAAMGLNWSPLLLDQLLFLTKQGWTKIQIREHFQKIKKLVQTIQSTSAEEEIQDEST
ncbi:hypothetical protein [Lihuaxuella thermophila]|uniref:hypothetical protein n=1 Tax=Lihuaxuella thermophila TaxID=1173111 RepID=UPI00111452F2|nr:hypothetical protein [Lihuaxuella thermophila]